MRGREKEQTKEIPWVLLSVGCYKKQSRGQVGRGDKRKSYVKIFNVVIIKSGIIACVRHLWFLVSTMLCVYTVSTGSNTPDANPFPLTPPPKKKEKKKII